LNQTQHEEQEVEKKRSMLLAKKSAASAANASGNASRHLVSANQTKATTAFNGSAAVQITKVNKSDQNEARPRNATLLSKAAKVNVAASTVVDLHANASVLSDTVRKLLEENQRLTKEKETLKNQLNAQQMKSEKAKLRQKLRNRLLVADRRLKAKKEQAGKSVAKMAPPAQSKHA